ncbi:uncharacterized protein C11orf16 homolog [Hemicordylus capensis]|uniref:uncharacterized protein C11orf16 homolog n=1 Tax=Hemicordylus capensis TaxID=884348 RepID=UPI002303CC60|nr:uncharacterized protein C11orf16 homolog [Hemicordylus capensis]XP_053140434.1 uncharacterized protein C11orf16 homolog [Hemicordylus capensis]
MDNCMWCFPPYPSHCWTIPTQAKSSFTGFLANPSSIYSHSSLASPACVARSLNNTRCLYLGHCPHFPVSTWKAAKNLEGSLDIAGVPVLARRETDGYYYLGTVIKEIQGEKRTFLVQFAKPVMVGEGDTSVQKTASNDILEYVNGMRHSILPGDKVLAPWEPEQKRYGPGTVLLGIETRDPLRAKEDEEITVSFWNGTKAKVPVGIALWIPPAQWKRIVDMIHRPLTSRNMLGGQLQQANYYICSCRSLPAPMPACTLGGLQWSRCSFICPGHSSFHHTCPLLASTLCGCCCPKPSGWWQEPSLPILHQGDSRKPSTQQLLALEGAPKEEAVAAAVMSSSSSCSSDSQSNEETCPAKISMVDHAVNTDSSLFDKPKLQETRRPDWKYWKRSHPKSHLKSQGTQHFC